MYILIKDTIKLKVLFVVFNEQKLITFDEVINVITAREYELFLAFNSSQEQPIGEPKTLYEFDENGVSYHKDCLYITVITESEKDIKTFGDSPRTLVLKMTETKENLLET